MRKVTRSFRNALAQFLFSLADGIEAVGNSIWDDSHWDPNRAHPVAASARHDHWGKRCRRGCPAWEAIS